MDISFEKILLLAGILFVIFIIKHIITYAKRQSVIKKYRFPSTIKNKVKDKYPHLNGSELDQVMEGLREYFHISHKAGRRMISMPSQVVDVAWHEFILFTHEYQRFCHQALGRFLHHTPAEAMKSKTQAHDGIKRAWRLSCLREKMNPLEATALPLLFAIDSQLEIEDGFKYSLNCLNTGDPYCAGHIGCGGGCAGGCGSDGGCSGGGGGD